MRRRRGALGMASDAFFYGYTGLCVVAGGLGAVFARTDIALARAIGRAVDGRPRVNAYAFGGSELVGLVLIFAHTRSTLGR